MSTYIDVRIPWEPGRKLGYACNRAMKTVEDWVLILDWDVLLLNINWYDICLNAINKLGHSVGLFSCLTNRIGCSLQKAHNNVDCDDIRWHMEYAAKCQEMNDPLIDITEDKRKLSGLFFLTHREAWDKVGGVPDDKFLGMDNYYNDRIKEAGYKVYLLNNLYVYHNYRRQWKESNQ